MPWCTPLCALVVAFLWGATAAAAQSLPVRYVYDELGRLTAVIDQNGDAAAYHYDAVGNLTGITRTNAGTVAIFDFTPNGAPIGAAVTVYGVGFSATALQNAVTINGTTASVTSSTTTTLSITVPLGATTGTLAVTTPSGSASATPSFIVGTVTAGPAITGISPTLGVAGTTVTVTGSGFDTILSNDKLSVNLTYGPPTSATSTQLVANVPTGGTSGRVTLSTPAGTATSAQDFFVAPAPYVATDVLVTDRMTIGTDKVVTLGTASKIGLVVFDMTAGQRASLKISAATIPMSVVSVRDPYAHTVGTATAYASGFIEPFRAPVTGSYTVMVDPSITYTGSATLRAYDVPADLAGTIVPGGSSVAFTIAAPGQNGRWTFSGTLGQRISLLMTNSTIALSYITVLGPNDSTLVSQTSSTFIDTLTLPSSGSYTIVVNPVGLSVGTATLTLYEVPADASGTITPGGSAQTLTMNTPGQNGALTFSGTAGQRVSVTVSTGPLGSVTVRKPDTTVLTSGSVGVLTSFIEPVTLPTTGTYSIAVNPNGVGTGSVTLTLHDVPGDVTGTITAGGAAVTVTTTVAGQNGSLTFTGTAGQRVSATVSAGPGGTVSIRRANGTSLTSAGITSLAGFIEPVTLPAAETYTVSVDYTGSATGAVAVQLFDVPADVTGTVTVGGSALAVTITAPGQNASIAFGGTAAQQVTVRLTGNTMGLTSVKLLKPDGSQLTLASSSGSNFNLSTQILPTTGTYAIAIDPAYVGTGTISVSVTNP